MISHPIPILKQMCKVVPRLESGCGLQPRGTTGSPPPPKKDKKGWRVGCSVYEPPLGCKKFTTLLPVRWNWHRVLSNSEGSTSVLTLPPPRGSIYVAKGCLGVVYGAHAMGPAGRGPRPPVGCPPRGAPRGGRPSRGRRGRRGGGRGDPPPAAGTAGAGAPPKRSERRYGTILRPLGGGIGNRFEPYSNIASEWGTKIGKKS